MADESFANTLTRACEHQSEIWADQMIDIADKLNECQPSHEVIGAARLQVHARDRLIWAYNARYRQDKGGVQVNVAVAVTLSEQDRAKLIDRWERAQQGLADTGQHTNRIDKKAV